MATKYGFKRPYEGALRYELVEMAGHEGDPLVKPCHWTRAHAWVLAGGVHNTGLWRGFDGRIRYAKGEEGAQ